MMTTTKMATTSVGCSGKLYAFHRREWDQEFQPNRTKARTRSSKDVHDRNLSSCLVTSVRVPTNPICKLSSSKYISLKPTSAASLNVNSRCDLSSFRGMGLIPSHDNRAGDHVNHLTGRIPVLPRYRTMTTFVSRASMGVPCSFHHAQMTDKPKWWWRTLACIPYLMPLHILSLCAHNVAEYIPLMSGLEILANPFTGNELPRWFSMAYFYATYFGVARNEKWPKFLRFHMLMSMLFDTALQITMISSSWFPCARYWHHPFWTAIGIAFYFAIFECIRHALQGTYSDIPFFTDAACMHIR